MLLNQIINQQLRDEQVGYRSGRSTTEQIFVLRTMNIIEQVIESVHDSTCVLLILRKPVIVSTERHYGTC